MNTIKIWLKITVIIVLGFVSANLLNMVQFRLMAPKSIDGLFVNKAKTINLSLLSNGDISAQQDAAVSKVSPSVVSIYGYSAEEQKPESKQADFLNIFSRSGRKHLAKVTKMTAGTGFFVDSDGYILTNRHVVETIDSDYNVVLESGEKIAANVVYRDSVNDLAIRAKVENTVEKKNNFAQSKRPSERGELAIIHAVFRSALNAGKTKRNTKAAIK